MVDIGCDESHAVHISTQLVAKHRIHTPMPPVASSASEVLSRSPISKKNDVVTLVIQRFRRHAVHIYIYSLFIYLLIYLLFIYSFIEKKKYISKK